MATVNHRGRSQFRHTNKEPEWSSICNNVFDEYLDPNDVFTFDQNFNERNSSPDSLNIFDFSGSSEQSHDTEATSPPPTLETSIQPVALLAKQPQAKEPLTFWAKTLRALEQNAAASEHREQNLRPSKSHPDFLSLGGYPSPPVIPLTANNQGLFIQQRLPKPGGNGKRRNVTTRSLSRGRPTGVSKPAVAGSVNPQSSARKYSVSPHKKMDPSRYRTGFNELLTEMSDSGPKRCKFETPSSPLFCTPPPSDSVFDENRFTRHESYPNQRGAAVIDEYIEPLAVTFQQTHIHTPLASPMSLGERYVDNLSFEPMPQLPANLYNTPSRLSSDRAPLYPRHSSPVEASQIQSFDFGFPKTRDQSIWASTMNETRRHSSYSIDSLANPTTFGYFDPNILPTTEIIDPNTVGLGLSCDPLQVSSIPQLHDTTILSTTIYQPGNMNATPHYHVSNLDDLHSTPRRFARSTRRSLSPSPPATEPRSSRRASSSRRTSRHRRTKSTNSSNRNSQVIQQGSFVNFTAEDSNKILNGVAPSGSSKTKARREKEAADKRRRFSQAAVRAVVEAGGDLDALNKAGMLV